MLDDRQSMESIAKVAGVSVRLMYQALALYRSGRMDLFDRVADGSLSMNAALLKAGLMRKPTKLDRLISAWNSCSDADRTVLLIRAGVWPADLQSSTYPGGYLES